MTQPMNSRTYALFVFGNRYLQAMSIFQKAIDDIEALGFSPLMQFPGCDMFVKPEYIKLVAHNNDSDCQIDNKGS